jgi:hypothetical protein
MVCWLNVHVSLVSGKPTPPEYRRRIIQNGLVDYRAAPGSDGNVGLDSPHGYSYEMFYEYHSARMKLELCTVMFTNLAIICYHQSATTIP